MHEHIGTDRLNQKFRAQLNFCDRLAVAMMDKTRGAREDLQAQIQEQQAMAESISETSCNHDSMNETGFKKTPRTQQHATQRSVDIELSPGDIFAHSRVNKSIDSSTMRHHPGHDKFNPRFENYLRSYRPNGLEVLKRPYRKEDFEKFSVSEWRSLSFGYKVQFQLDNYHIVRDMKDGDL